MRVYAVANLARALQQLKSTNMRILGLDGEVVAVTSAVVTEFGGSNLGVPAARASMLLAQEAMARLRALAWR